jgi:hypothetical protein
VGQQQQQQQQQQHTTVTALPSLDGYYFAERILACTAHVLAGWMHTEAYLRRRQRLLDVKVKVIVGKV